MTLARWCLLLLASLATFLVAGLATVLCLLQFGQSLFGWHDTIGPEIDCGLLAGLLAAACLGAWLHARWSATTRRGEPA